MIFTGLKNKIFKRKFLLNELSGTTVYDTGTDKTNATNTGPAGS